MEPPTPRVNAVTLQSFRAGTTVRLVGQKVNENDSTVALQTLGEQGEGVVTVRKQPGNNSFVNGPYFEVVGVKNQDGSLTERRAYDWGTNFGMISITFLRNSLYFNMIYL